MSDPAETNGPRGDGSQSLARESKFGQAATVLVSAVVLALADAAGRLDVSPLPDWLEQAAVVAIGAVVGLMTAWATKNRRDFVGRQAP